MIVAMVALLSMTSAAMAQQQNGERKAPKKMDAQEMTTRMTKDLGLTADQQAKVLSLNKAYEDVLGGPRMGGRRPPKDGCKCDADKKKEQRPERPQMTDAQKAEMKQHAAKRKEYDQKLKGILTVDQYKSYKKMHHRHGPRGPRPGEQKK